MSKRKSILKKWEIAESELTDLVEQNPSLRGILLGYIAEKKFGSLGIAVTKPHMAVGCKTSDSHSSRDRGAERSV